MRLHAKGAFAAWTSARTSPKPIRRGKPEIGNVSSSKPASGTSCDSTRPGDPANVTVTPRSRSASATARAGRTCPAVPPAAITHRRLDDLAIDGDVKENAHAGEEDHEARAAVGDEGERDPGERRDAERGGEVDRSLPAHESGDACREQLPEPVPAAQRDPEARDRERGEGGDDEGRTDEAELLSDDREDHVGVRLREVRDLPDPLAEARSREASRADADRRLHDLEPGALSVAPRVEEAEHARPAVRLGPDREHSDSRGDDRRHDEQPDGHYGDEEDREHHPAEGDRGAEVGLHDDEPAEDRGQQAERLDELADGSRRSPSRQVPRGEEAERELRELGGLEARRAEDEPAARTVDRRPEDEHRRTQPERDEEERRREVPQAVVVEARGHNHEDDADEGVHRLTLQVAHGVPVPERGGGGGRAVHHHEPERDEPERDERDEPLVGVPVASHVSSSTSARKASPR